MQRCRPFALLATAALTCVGALASANVWVITHRTNPGGGAVIDSVGADSVGVAPMGTLLTEYTLGPNPKKLRELYLGGKHYDAVSVKPDGSEVIGRYDRESGGTQWCVFNLARMQKEQKVTNLNPGPGYTVVDVRYVDGMPTVLARKGSEFRADGLAADGTWRMVFSNANGDLSSLASFPRALSASYALGMAGKMPFVDIARATPKSDWSWWDFFGGRGSSEFGAFDPKAGIVAVRSAWKGDDLTIARSSPQGALAPIRLVKPGNLTQIAVIEGLTYVVVPSDKILVFDRAGNLTATLNGTSVAVD